MNSYGSEGPATGEITVFDNVFNELENPATHKKNSKNDSKTERSGRNSSTKRTERRPYCTIQTNIATVPEKT